MGTVNMPEGSGLVDLVNVLASDFGCSLECAWRSVIRHWPDTAAARDEVSAKCTRPCVVALNIFHPQDGYLKSMEKRLFPIGKESGFPYFSDAYRDVSSGDSTGRTWGQVACELNAPHHAHVYWLFLPCPTGVEWSVEALEQVFQALVVAEGMRDVVGFTSSADGVLPMVDYFSARQAGVSIDELRRRMILPPGTQLASSTRADLLEWKDKAEKNRNMMLKCLGVDLATAQVSSRVEGVGYRAPLLGNAVSHSVTSRQNKGSVQRTLSACGLTHIRSVTAMDWTQAEALRMAAGIEYPVVVKPVSGAGSEFVTLCYNSVDLKTAFGVAQSQQTFQLTDAHHMVVEDYIDGDEYVVNSVSYRGQHVITDVWRSWKYPVQCMSTRLRAAVEMALKERKEKAEDVTVPSQALTTALIYDRLELVHDLADCDASSPARRVVAYTLQCLDALGMQNGCAHCEVRIDGRGKAPTSGEPVLIELNPRMQGDTPRAAELVGYDQYSLLFYLTAAAAVMDQPGPRSSVGVKLPWPPAPQLYRTGVSTGSLSPITRHVVFFRALENGILNGVAAQRVLTLPTFLRFTRGELFKPHKNSVHRVSKTMDLFSSPGAVVLEGSTEDIVRDTSIIRELESAPVSSTTLVASLEKAALDNVVDDGEREVDSLVKELSMLYEKDGVTADEQERTEKRLDESRCKLQEQRRRRRLLLNLIIGSLGAPLFLPDSAFAAIQRAGCGYLLCLPDASS